jgi:hypothetical protein
MEYLPSRSLSQVVVEDGPMSPEAAARVGLAVLSALRAAHGVGVLHRDVKPGNVLIVDSAASAGSAGSAASAGSAGSGRAVLTDFGVATILGDPSVTRSGLVIGSPSYMAPERLREGSEAGAAADLWSLGATLYFAVEGRAPYERPGTLATVAALATEEPDPTTRAGPLEAPIEALLRRDPSKRPSAAAVERMLREVAYPRRRPTPPVTTAGGSATVVLGRPASASQRPVAWVAAALAVLAVLALAAWALAGSSRDRSSSPPAGTSRPTGSPTASPTRAGPATPTQPPAQPPASGVALPPGWRLYTDRTGFAVAVPRDWTVSRRGTIVYFSEPGGDRLLGIDQTDKPRPDPVADWAGQEAYRVARGDFPSYRHIRLEAVDYFDKAADWEFTYVRGGARVHVNNRGFITSPTQAYGMWWSTPDSRWERYLPDLRLIERSFVPAPNS